MKNDDRARRSRRAKQHAAKTPKNHDAQAAAQHRYLEFLLTHLGRAGAPMAGTWLHRLRLPIVWLSIDRLSPDPLVENRPAWVEFTLRNGTNETYSGFVELSVQPLHSVDPFSGNFDYMVTNLGPGQMIRGVISFVAPRADRGNTATLSFYQQVPPPPGEEFGSVNEIADATVNFDVAGRYSLTVDQVRIDNTASPHEDTVIMDVGGAFGDVTYENGTQNLGDHNNGTFDVNFDGAGPFNSVNGISPPAALFYFIANSGHPKAADTAAQVADWISRISAAAATVAAQSLVPDGANGAGWAALSAAVDAFTEWFNNTLASNCDTIVAQDTLFFSSQDLYDKTYDPNDQTSVWLQWRPNDYHRVGNSGPLCRDADYNVRVKIIRHRKPDEVPSEHVEPNFITPVRLGYGGEFGISYPSHSDTVWEWNVVGGTGRVDPTGLFKAPNVAQTSNYGVVVGTGLVNGEAKYWGVTIFLFG